MDRVPSDLYFENPKLLTMSTIKWTGYSVNAMFYKHTMIAF